MAGTTYTRQSTFIDGDVITASLFNNEYNQLENAFIYAATGTTGHQHDGTNGQGGNIYIIGDQDFLNKIEVDSSNNRWGFYISVGDVAVEQIRLQDGAIVPVTDNDIDLGTSSLEFKNIYIDGTANIDTLAADTGSVTGNFSVGGNLTVTGNATINGNLTFGDAATDTVAFGADINSSIIPETDNTYDLGSVTQEWRNLYIDGTANIDSLVADTADINGGTIDGAIIGSSSAASGTFTTATATTGNITTLNSTTVDTTSLEVTNLKAKDGTSAGSIADSTGVVTIASSVLTTTDINGGSIDGTTIGSTTASTGNFSTLSIGGTAITATAAELNVLDGITATTAELNYTDGVTSNIQTQLNTKAPIASPTFTGTVTIPTVDINAGAIDNTTIGATTASTGNFSTLSIGGTAITATAAELNILDGVTATTAEINYLDGVTSNIQTQINQLQTGDTDLEAIAALTPTDGVFIVGDGSTWVAESGATVRTSLGLTIGTDVLAYDSNLQSFVTTFTIPTTDGTSGQALLTDGAGNISFGDVDALPTQTGNSGYFLTTDGTNPSWAEVDALPDQTGNSGKYLTTDGTEASWDDIAQVAYTRTTYTATSGQVNFAASYDAGYVDVFLNGIKLLEGTDFTASGGSNIALTTGAVLNDSVEILAYTTASIVSQVKNPDGGFANSVYTIAQNINGGTA